MLFENGAVYSFDIFLSVANRALTVLLSKRCSNYIYKLGNMKLIKALKTTAVEIILLRLSILEQKGIAQAKLDF